MKFLWFTLFLLVMACIGIAYVFTDAWDYFFPKQPQTQIVVETASDGAV